MQTEVHYIKLVSEWEGFMSEQCKWVIYGREKHSVRGSKEQNNRKLRGEK